MCECSQYAARTPFPIFLILETLFKRSYTYYIYTYARYLFRSAAHLFKYLHDLCLVRPPETSGNGCQQTLALDARHSLLLGNCPLRVHLSGARQSSRYCGQRRSVLSHSAQGDTRSHITHRIHIDSNLALQGTASAMEPFGSVFLPPAGGFLCILEIRLQKNRKIFPEKFGVKEKISTFAIPNENNR